VLKVFIRSHREVALISKHSTISVFTVKTSAKGNVRSTDRLLLRPVLEFGWILILATSGLFITSLFLTSAPLIAMTTFYGGNHLQSSFAMPNLPVPK
jgi:hypothetical protein